MKSSPSDQLIQFILAKWISRPIYVAASLGIADLLAEGPLSVDTLAQKCDAHPPSLYRILRSLAAVGIFREVASRSFELTPMGEYLQSDRLRPIALMFHSSWHEHAWAQLLEAVKTGDDAFEMAHGAPAFQWFRQNPAAAAEFQAANASKADRFHAAVLAGYDFSTAATIADVGGGRGTLLIQILHEYPHLKGLVYDLPEVVEGAAQTIAGGDTAQRCKVRAGDFFEQVPAGCEIYLLANVLHNWDDESCRRILYNCHKAMPAGSELLVIEALISTGNTFSVAKLLDIEGMVMGGGRERTEIEYRELLAASGFTAISVNSLMDGNALLVATRT